MYKLKHLYLVNKSKKVGDSCVCPSCLVSFVKGSYQQIFCRTKAGTYCKDQYWNKVDPKKRNNTTRISPAAAFWLEDKLLEYARTFHRRITLKLNKKFNGNS